MGARGAGRIGWQGTASPTILRADFCESHAASRGLTTLPSGSSRRPAAAGPTCWGAAAATVPCASLYPAIIESRYRIPTRLRQGYGGQAAPLRNSCKGALTPPCYRIPESHCHSTFVILPAATSTSNGPKRPMLLFLPFMETL